MLNRVAVAQPNRCVQQVAELATQRLTSVNVSLGLYDSSAELPKKPSTEKNVSQALRPFYTAAQIQYHIQYSLVATYFVRNNLLCNHVSLD